MSSETLLDLSRQRDATATEDTTRTTVAAEHAADEVRMYLGSSVDSTDATAVALGSKLAYFQYKTVWTGRVDLDDVTFLSTIRTELKQEAERRVLEEDLPYLGDVDHSAIDARYPSTDWDV